LGIEFFKTAIRKVMRGLVIVDSTERKFSSEEYNLGLEFLEYFTITGASEGVKEGLHFTGLFRSFTQSSE